LRRTENPAQASAFHRQLILSPSCPALRRKSTILSVDHCAWLAFHVIAAIHPFIASGNEIEIREGPKPPRGRIRNQ
jgi:hypothetical protein